MAGEKGIIIFRRNSQIRILSKKEIPLLIAAEKQYNTDSC
jgi:hypothetical protein